MTSDPNAAWGRVIVDDGVDGKNPSVGSFLVGMDGRQVGMDGYGFVEVTFR